MNHSKAHTPYLCRAAHIPLHAVIKTKTDDPILLRRSCDITAACGRKSDGEDGAVMMQMHLSRTTPLWRCIAVGAAAIGVTAALIGICRAKRQLLLRRKYARRYAEQLKLQKMKLQARSRSCDSTRADAKTL